MFGVYHPKKVNKICVVFDSSATYLNLSLNNVLLKGPDLTNSLLGVMLKFRTEAIAITCDIQQMFCNFKVPEHHRDFLRFFWYKDNNFDELLIEYMMTVHIFGNSPPPVRHRHTWTPSFCEELKHYGETVCQRKFLRRRWTHIMCFSGQCSETDKGNTSGISFRSLSPNTQRRTCLHQTRSLVDY